MVATRLLPCIAAILFTLLFPSLGQAADGQIAGTVVAAASKAPLEGIEVCARRIELLSATACAETDSAGEYTVAGLPADEYEVRFSVPLGSPDPDYLTQYYHGRAAFMEGDPVPVTAGATTGSIDAEMQLAAKIAGTVEGADTETPLEGVWVCASQAKGRALNGPFCDVTDSAGEYSIPALPAGAYKVRFNGGFGPSAGYVSEYYDDKPTRKLSDSVSVGAGSTTAGIDAALQPGGKITGTVVEAGSEAPIQYIQVCASRASSSICRQTDASGEYTIDGLSGGSYAVHFWPSGQLNYLDEYYDDQPSEGMADPVAVAVGSTTSGIDAELQAGGRIGGEVVDAVSEEPAPAVQACAIDGEGEFVRCDYTDSDGEYTIAGLPSDDYSVRFAPGQEFPFGTPPNYNYLTRFYDGKATRQEASPVSVTVGALTSGIDAEMVEGGRISGEVLDAGSKAPVGGAQVCAYASADDESVSCTNTGADGGYVLEGLVSGEYEIAFSAIFANEGNYLRQYYDDKATAAEATPVTATVGATTTGIDAELRAGGQIKGVVTAAASGLPARYVQVCAYAEGESEEEERFRCGETNAKGQYTISGLPSGAYRVRFSARYYVEEEVYEEEFVTQYYSGKPSLALAAPVTVTAGAVTGSIDAQMVVPGAEEGSGGQPAGGSPPPSGGGQPGPGPTRLKPPLHKRPKPPRCKKGFKKKRAGGKVRCVKLRHHHR